MRIPTFITFSSFYLVLTHKFECKGTDIPADSPSFNHKTAICTHQTDCCLLKSQVLKIQKRVALSALSVPLKSADKKFRTFLMATFKTLRAL